MKYKWYEPYLFIAPGTIILLLIFFYPVVRLFRDSLMAPRGNEMVLVGLNNFRYLFSDDVFRMAITNNAKLLLSVPIMVGLALFLAILLFEQIRGWQFYRTTLFLPYLLSITVVGVIFGYMFQYRGVVNTLLQGIGLGTLAKDWLGKSEYALWVVMIVIIWKEVGFGVVLFLARLMSVQEELFEAARLDGANWLQLQWYITIPQLKSVIEFFTVISVFTMLSWVFNYIYVMTNGGPGNATMVTELYIYLMGFRYRMMHIASATSVLLVGITIVFILLQNRILGEEGAYA
jgi:ABC-type sugar transport system permease subunit